MLAINVYDKLLFGTKKTKLGKVLILLKMFLGNTADYFFILLLSDFTKHQF